MATQFNPEWVSLDNNLKLWIQQQAEQQIAYHQQEIAKHEKELNNWLDVQKAINTAPVAKPVVTPPPAPVAPEVKEHVAVVVAPEAPAVVEEPSEIELVEEVQPEPVAVVVPEPVKETPVVPPPQQQPEPVKEVPVAPQPEPVKETPVAPQPEPVKETPVAPQPEPVKETPAPSQPQQLSTRFGIPPTPVTQNRLPPPARTAVPVTENKPEPAAALAGGSVMARLKMFESMNTQRPAQPAREPSHVGRLPGIQANNFRTSSLTPAINREPQPAANSTGSNNALSLAQSFERRASQDVKVSHSNNNSSRDEFPASSSSSSLRNSGSQPPVTPVVKASAPPTPLIVPSSPSETQQPPQQPPGIPEDKAVDPDQSGLTPVTPRAVTRLNPLAKRMSILNASKRPPPQEDIKARALFNYTGDISHKALKFKQYDQFVVTSRQGDWWAAEVLDPYGIPTGITGFIPRTFVEIIPHDFPPLLSREQHPANLPPPEPKDETTEEDGGVVVFPSSANTAPTAAPRTGPVPLAGATGRTGPPPPPVRRASVAPPTLGQAPNPLASPTPPVVQPAAAVVAPTIAAPAPATRSPPPFQQPTPPPAVAVPAVPATTTTPAVVEQAKTQPQNQDDIPEEERVRYATAKYNWKDDTEGADYLAITKGQRYQIVGSIREQWWFAVDLLDISKSGYVPSNYIILDEQPQ